MSCHETEAFLESLYNEAIEMGFDEEEAVEFAYSFLQYDGWN